MDVALGTELSEVGEGELLDVASGVGVAENAEVANEVATLPAGVVMVWKVFIEVSCAKVRVVERRRRRRVVRVVDVGM